MQAVSGTCSARSARLRTPAYLDDPRWQEPTCAETAYESKGAAAQRELGEIKAARVRVGDSDADDDDDDTAVRGGASAGKRKASASGKFVFLLIFYFFYVDAAAD